jgi:WD40 repeat protein
MVSSVAFMPSDEEVVSGSRDHTVKIWSVSD